MKRYAISFALILVVALIVGTISVEAQWVQNGTPICIQPYSQSYPEICSDGAGGVIMTWNDYRTPEGMYLKGDIYAQRIDASGNILWTTDGVEVCLASDDQGYPKICSDGAGGAILVWADYRTASHVDVYAQRVDANGNALWIANGIAVCDTVSHQQHPEVVSDGLGGVIITWQDYRNGSDYNIYAQRIDGDGNTLWTSQGVALCTAAYWQEYPQIVTDGEHGAIVVWKDTRAMTNTDIYAQRVDSSGTTKWMLDGYAICWEGTSQSNPVVAPDGLGGVFIAWADTRNGDADIFAQWIQNSGSPRWITNGITVSTAANHQNSPVVLGNGAYGAFFAWRDQRSAPDDYELYAQRINSFGNPAWAANGIKIVDEVGDETVWDVISDGAGGVIFSWMDGRTGASDIYVQRVNEDGNDLWTTNGVMVCDAIRQQTTPELLADGGGGCFVVSADERAGNGAYDIYAQRVERNGYWGYPSPLLSDVEDVPADQGGEVTVRWGASRLDNYTYGDITHYSVWRSLTGSEAMILINGENRIADVVDVSEGFAGPAVRKSVFGSATYYWEWVGNMDAHFLEHYAYSTATKNDSMAGNPAMEYFFVSAHASDPFVYWDSAPDSGYSVDNLAPCAPVALTGEQSFVPEGLDISWEPNTEIDISHYNVYRGLSDDFIPGSGNLLTCLPDTMIFDGDWRWDIGYYYKVSAVDIHGNESAYALFGPTDVTGEDTPEVPLATYLEQNYPNPFNPVTTISFGLSESAFVSLRIYDAAGRTVRELVDGSREAGVYSETWDGKDGGGREAASGIYFYKLVAGSHAETRKMVLLR